MRQKFVACAVFTCQGILMLTVALGPLLNPGKYFWRMSPDRPLRWLALFADLTGVTVVIWSKRAMGRSFAATPFPRGELVTWGPYAFVRNPMHTGGLMMCAAWSVWHSSWVAATATAILGIVLCAKVSIEEELLRERHGTAYLKYFERTGRFLPILRGR